MPLYKVESPFSKASNTMNQAAGTFSRMQAGSKTTTEGPGETVGGSIMSGAGGAMAGIEIGKAVATGATAGPWGAGIGALVGIGAYLLS